MDIESRVLLDGPSDATRQLVLAPGAGAGMRSPFMAGIAALLAEREVAVARFEFAYMREGRRRPDREPALRKEWLEMIEALGGAEQLIIGGKSMGGRIASMVADEAGVRGLVCLGYPFHPTGRPERLRTAHLEQLATPTLIVQGTRDPFGTSEDVAGYALAPTVRLHWLEDGDHSFKPRKASGHSEGRHLASAADAVAEFVRGL